MIDVKPQDIGRRVIGQSSGRVGTITDARADRFLVAFDNGESGIFGPFDMIEFLEGEDMSKQTREEKYREQQRQRSMEEKKAKAAEDVAKAMRGMSKVEYSMGPPEINMNDLVRVAFGLGGTVTATATMRQETPEESLKRQVESLKGKISRLENDLNSSQAFINQLQESACAVGLVSAVDEKTCTVRIGGLTVSAALPDPRPVVGDFVKLVQPSNQILGIVKAPRVGATGSVTHVADDGTIEVSCNGQSRSVVCSAAVGTPEVGDMVVIDETGYFALTRAAEQAENHAFTAETGVSWDDIGGLEHAKEALREAIEYPVTHAELYRAYGKRPSKGVLLYGPAGVGKTMLGKAVATSLQGMRGVTSGFLYVKGPELLNKYVGATEDAIRALFDKARKHHKETGHPGVIFIDEAEALLGARGQRSLSGLESTVVPTFLAEMDGLVDSRVFVLLSTNRPDVLDPAITRDGRIDRKVQVTRPRQEQAKEILCLLLRHVPLLGDRDTVITETIRHVFSDAATVLEIGEFEDVTVKLLLRDVISGAVLAGIVGRATERAIARDRKHGSLLASGVTSGDLEQSVHDAAAELRHTNLLTEAIEAVTAAVGQKKAQEWRRSDSKVVN